MYKKKITKRKYEGKKEENAEAFKVEIINLYCLIMAENATLK